MVLAEGDLEGHRASSLITRRTIDSLLITYPTAFGRDPVQQRTIDRFLAEGVETREQLEFLRRHGCNHIQGYLFGRPMAADDYRAFLNKLSRAAEARDELSRAMA